MNEKIISVLRDLLEKAQRGEIIAIAVATILGDLSTGSTYKLGDATLAELLGAIDLLKHRVLTSSDEKVE